MTLHTCRDPSFTSSRWLVPQLYQLMTLSKTTCHLQTKGKYTHLKVCLDICVVWVRIVLPSSQQIHRCGQAVSQTLYETLQKGAVCIMPMLKHGLTMSLGTLVNNTTSIPTYTSCMPIFRMTSSHTNTLSNFH